MIDFSSQANIVYYSFYYIPFCQCDSAVILKVSQVSTSNFDVTVMFGLCLFCESKSSKEKSMAWEAVSNLCARYILKSSGSVYAENMCPCLYLSLKTTPYVFSKYARDFTSICCFTLNSIKGGILKICMRLKIKVLYKFSLCKRLFL